MTDKLVQIVLRSLTEISPDHVDDRVAMYSSEWWTETRTLDDVQLMLEHASLVVAFDERETGDLAARADPRAGVSASSDRRPGVEGSLKKHETRTGSAGFADSPAVRSGPLTMPTL